MSNTLPAIWLRREGNHVVVLVEFANEKGRWIRVIRETIDGPFSHIIEPGGILDAAGRQRRSAQ